MGKRQSKHEVEVIINNNTAISSNVGMIQRRIILGDFELIQVMLAILVIGYLIVRKVKEYLTKTVRRQVVVQNV